MIRWLILAVSLGLVGCLEDVGDPRPGPRTPLPDGGSFDPGPRPSSSSGYGSGSGSGSGSGAGSGAGSTGQGSGALTAEPGDAGVDAGETAS